MAEGEHLDVMWSIQKSKKELIIELWSDYVDLSEDSIGETVLDELILDLGIEDISMTGSKLKMIVPAKRRDASYVKKKVLKLIEKIVLGENAIE